MLAYQLAHAATVDARLDAVAELGERAGRPDQAPAAGALAAAARGDRFWAVRQAAVQALAAFGLPADSARPAGAARSAAGDSARAAVLAATRDADSRVRDAAATVLPHFPGPAAVELLRQLAGGDPSPFVRGGAVHGLAALDPGAALPVIEALLREPSWVDVLRTSAIYALARVPADSAIPILEQNLGPDHTRFVRQAALQTLPGSARGHEAEVAQRLVPLLGDADLFIRGDAARSLGLLGQRSAVPALQARHRVEVEGRVVQALDEALKRLGGE